MKQDYMYWITQVGMLISLLLIIIQITYRWMSLSIQGEFTIILLYMGIQEQKRKNW